MSTRELLCSMGLLLDDSSESSDSHSLHDSYSYMAQISLVSDHYLLNKNLYKNAQVDPVVYMDGGADSCIGGIGWIVLAYTGRKANLNGYDDQHTKNVGLDICILATRYHPPNGDKPYLLVAHEMIFNPGSSVSLLSEF